MKLSNDAADKTDEANGINEQISLSSEIFNRIGLNKFFVVHNFKMVLKKIFIKAFHHTVVRIVVYYRSSLSTMSFSHYLADKRVAKKLHRKFCSNNMIDIV